MSRSFILCVAVFVITGGISLLPGGPGVAQGQVLQDTFDDNKQATMWSVFGSSTSAKVSEANKRLQFVTSSDANEVFVGYISNKWWIDPIEDFQMKADLYFDISAAASGWVALGLTSNASAPGNNYIMAAIGRTKNFKNYWWELNDDDYRTMDFVGRSLTAVTFYISYDADNDILYVGDTGYGADNAWQTINNFAATYWGKVPFYVYLGVTEQNMAITAGTVYIDNFVIEKGKIGSAYQDDGSDGSTVDDTVIADVEASLAIAPSTIDRSASGDRITAIVSLPVGITLADWDSQDIPTLSPGKVEAGVQAAFNWVDGTVRVLASFSKSALLANISTAGQTELYFVGTLTNDRTYAASCTVTIK